MRAQEVLSKALSSTQFLMTAYLSDMTDADLQAVPVPGMNSIAWQIGHLIASEKYLIAGQLPNAQYPALPPTVERLGSGKTAKEFPQGAELPKAELLDLFNKVRAASIATVEKASDAEIDQASTGRMAAMAPTVADIVLLVANHTLMHAGQFVAVRRAAGKPVVI